MNVSERKSRKTELETLSVLSLFLLVLASVTEHHFFMYFAMGLLVIALFIRPLARKITQGWLATADVLGVCNSRIVLTLVFYFFLTPIALVFRFFNKNALNVVFPKGAGSYFSFREHTFVKQDLEKMW